MEIPPSHIGHTINALYRWLESLLEVHINLVPKNSLEQNYAEYRDRATGNQFPLPFQVPTSIDISTKQCNGRQWCEFYASPAIVFAKTHPDTTHT